MITPMVELNERENQVLQLMLQDIPQYKIAKRMHRSDGTIDRYAQALYTKHGVQSRLQLILKYHAQQQVVVTALTKRQNQILRLVLEGKTNPQIVMTIHLSETRVVRELGQIYRVLGIKNRRALFLLFDRKKFASIDDLLRFLDKQRGRQLWVDMLKECMTALGYPADYNWLVEREAIINLLHQIAVQQKTFTWSPNGNLVDTIQKLWEQKSATT
jgi:DNA-binding CsgD family transcriptional regulator